MDFENLVRATETLDGEHVLRIRLGPVHWRTLAGSMAPRDMAAGELLLAQGEPERALFLLEQGTLQVYAVPARQRVELLQPGSAVGEASLFADGPAAATVEAMTHCIVWTLPAARVAQLAQRSPEIAFEVLRAAGALLVRRLRDCQA